MSNARPRDLKTLRGDELLAALVERGDREALELLWRVEQAELAQRLASPLAAVDEPRLADLLLSELSAPAMPPGVVRPHILAAIDEHRPRLSDESVRELDEGLRDSEASTLVPAADQELLERWLFAQPGKPRDEYALFVIENEGDLDPAAATLVAALARCRENPDLRARVAQAYRHRLLEKEEALAWTAAADFIEAACAASNRQPEVLVLVGELIRLAPLLLGPGPIRPVLTALIRSHGFEAVKAQLSAEGDVPASVGMTGLLEIADGFPRQEQRLDVFLLAYSRHPTQWPTLEPLATAWDDARWGQTLRRILKTPEADLPAKLSPLVSLAPIEFSALLVQIAATHQRPDDPELPEAVSKKSYDAFNEARTAGQPRAAALWWPLERDETGRSFLRDLIAGFGTDEDWIEVLAAGLTEAAVAPSMIVSLLPDSMTAALLEHLQAIGVPDSLYRQVLDALHEQRPAELSDAATRLQPKAFNLDVTAVLAPTEPETAFRNAEAAYESMDAQQRDAMLGLLEQYGTPTQLPVVERFARASERSERARRARAFTIVGRLASKGIVPDYLTEGVRLQDNAVSAAAFAAISALQPRDPKVLRELREMASTDGRIARPAGAALDALSDGFAAELRGRITGGQRCELLTLLGAGARPQAIDVMLEHLGDAEWDDIAVHRAAADSVVEAVPFVTVTTAQLERLGELLDGDTQESDPPVREALSRAAQLASLGPNEALDLLYTMAKYRPKANPEDLFGVERGTLVRQLGLYKRELDRGAVGRSNSIAHLDNVAERIVRAAYLKLGSSADIKARIEASPRDPDYGHILKALGGELDKARNGFGRLHDIRSEETEVPHSGKPTTDSAWTSAQDSFAHAANVCLHALDEAISPPV